jgi:FkbM family methyltransferase
MFRRSVRLFGYLLRDRAARKRIPRAVWRAARGPEPIFLDYPLDPRPRYGYRQPPHPELFALIDSKRSRYLELLSTFGTYAAKLSRIEEYADAAGSDPYWQNPYINGLDGIALYCFPALNNSTIYLEIGSGNSTKFVRRSIRDNELCTRVISIDPAPRAEVDGLCDEIIREPLEGVDLDVFGRLGSGDVLVFDGSHHVFQNSDVTVFFLEIMPRLAPGVLVYVDDIFCPTITRRTGAERFTLNNICWQPYCSGIRCGGTKSYFRTFLSTATMNCSKRHPPYGRRSAENRKGAILQARMGWQEKECGSKSDSPTPSMTKAFDPANEESLLQKLRRKNGVTITRTENLGRYQQKQYLRRLFPLLEIDLVLDVGANRGQFAKFIRNSVRYKGPMVSFEPINELAAGIRTDPQWKVIAAAVGDHEGRDEFNEMESSPLSSFLTPTRVDTDTLSHLNRVKRSFSVDVVTIDGFLRRPEYARYRNIYLKLDTQGYEERCLDGALDSLPRIAALQAELSVVPLYEDVPSYLALMQKIGSLGYSLSLTPAHDAAQFPEIIDLDIHYVRRDRLKSLGRLNR